MQTKLTELDDHISLEQRKVAKIEHVDEFTRHRVAARLRSLQYERSSRLEAAAASREALRSQISRIRETIHQILNEDTTFAEPIRTLFCEQVSTSPLSAIGMTISTGVLALTGGGGDTPTPAPPSEKGGLKEWVKKTLQSPVRALAKLAGKIAAARTSIIGNLMSWLLSLLATVGLMAQNVWALVLAVGGLLYVVARDWLASSEVASAR